MGWNRGKHVREAGNETGLVSWGQATRDLEHQVRILDFVCTQERIGMGKTFREFSPVAQTTAVVILTRCIIDILCAPRTR